jgi:hypothetical protein
MPVQLSLLDDEDTPRKSTPVWSALPDDVRAELSQGVATYPSGEGRPVRAARDG